LDLRLFVRRLRPPPCGEEGEGVVGEGTVFLPLVVGVLRVLGFVVFGGGVKKFGLVGFTGVSAISLFFII